MESERNQHAAVDWVNPVAEATAIESLRYSPSGRSHKRNWQPVAAAIDEQQQAVIEKIPLEGRQAKIRTEPRGSTRPDDARQQERGSQCRAKPPARCSLPAQV